MRKKQLIIAGLYKFKKIINMKKGWIILLSACTMLLAGTACKKEHTEKEAIRKTIDVTLTQDQNYTFTLTKNLRDDEYRITEQAQHYLISNSGTTSAGDRVYTYQPAAGYYGTDEVIVRNDWERDEHAGHSHGNCQGGPPPPNGADHGGQCNKPKGEEDHYIYTFRFTINRTIESAAK